MYVTLLAVMAGEIDAGALVFGAFGAGFLLGGLTALAGATGRNDRIRHRYHGGQMSPGKVPPVLRNTEARPFDWTRDGGGE